MGLQIIGAGFGRTGTTSTKAALEMLGFGPCYHMYEVMANLDHVSYWQDAANGEAVDWQKPLADYRATLDWPACTYWQEIYKANPQAKVLLTIREPAAWYESVKEVLYPRMAQASEPNHPLVKMAHKTVLENTFHRRFLDKDYAIDIFQKHNQAVIDTVSPDRLLVFEAHQGWEPLCAFLSVDIPAEGFPRKNMRKKFKEDTK